MTVLSHRQYFLTGDLLNKITYGKTMIMYNVYSPIDYVQEYKNEYGHTKNYCLCRQYHLPYIVVQGRRAFAIKEWERSEYDSHTNNFYPVYYYTVDQYYVPSEDERGDSFWETEELENCSCNSMIEAVAFIHNYCKN
jgi:hypothetical protein